MKNGRAFVAGVVGGAVMSILMAIAREALGIPMSLELMLGTLTGLAPGRGTFAVGLVMHLVASGMIATLYAAGFEWVTHRAGALTGTLFSLSHVIMAGAALGIVRDIHPLAGETLGTPGPFYSAAGDSAVLMFVLGHALFGMIVGATYGAVLHPPRTAPSRSYGRRMTA